MEEFKGTPGPWERGGGTKGGGELVVYCNNSLGSAVCDATSHYSIFDKQTRIANLNLMAAAPDLLEALQTYMSAVKRMNESMNDGCNVQGAISALIGSEDMANAAIAKALGKEQS